MIIILVMFRYHDDDEITYLHAICKDVMNAYIENIKDYPEMINQKWQNIFADDAFMHLLYEIPEVTVTSWLNCYLTGSSCRGLMAIMVPGHQVTL